MGNVEGAYQLWPGCELLGLANNIQEFPDVCSDLGLKIE